MKRIAGTIILALVWGGLISVPALAAGTVMIETKVLTVQGQDLGAIKRVALSEDGCIKYVILSSRGRLIPIPWRAMTVSPERHAVVLGINRTILEKAPAMRSGEWARMGSSQWEHQVDQFYESHISRGKERLHERTGEVGKPEGTSTQGAKSRREPAAPGRSLEAPAKTEQPQPPSKLRQEEESRPGQPPKESIEKGRQKHAPSPSGAPGAVQQPQQSEKAGPGAMMKQGKPGESPARGAEKQGRRPEEQGKHDSKKIEE